MARPLEKEFEVTDELVISVLRENGMRVSISDAIVEDAMDLLDVDEISDLALNAGEDYETRFDAASVLVESRLREAGFFD